MNVIFSFFATAPQLDLFTRWVNEYARQKSLITPEFIGDQPTGAILTAESRIKGFFKAGQAALTHRLLVGLENALFPPPPA